jgi:hypothetical protein
MTISIKRRSGGEILHVAQAFHTSIADAYREKYAAVPVKRKHPRTSVSVKLQTAFVKLRAQDFVKRIAEIRAKYD